MLIYYSPLYFKHPVAKAVYEASADKMPYDFDGEDFLETALSEGGKIGGYNNVPMPYQQDLLPAIQRYKYYDLADYPYEHYEPAGVHIPLQSAKFYNLPLQSMAFYDNSFYWYSELNFGKYSKVKEQQLKKIIKPLQKKPSWDPVTVEKTENGDLILSCYVVTSG